MKTLLLSLAMLATSHVALAQVPGLPPPPAFVFDRYAIPGLGVEAPIPAELDGTVATREWVQTRYAPSDGVFEVRGLALRGTLCMSGWTRPYSVAEASLVPGDMLLFGFLGTPTAGGLARYIVLGVRGYYEITIPYGC